MTKAVEPWQVWYVDFDPTVGREQAGFRPAVVVGTPFACQLDNGLVLLVPCTTKDRGLVFHPQVTSLPRPTYALCDQVRATSRERLLRLATARICAADIAAIKFTLRQMIDTT